MHADARWCVDFKETCCPLCYALCCSKVYTLPSSHVHPCLHSSGHEPWLRASRVLWLSINSGMWSISFQPLKKRWAQGGSVQTLTRISVQQQIFFFLFCSGCYVEHSLLNWPDRPHERIMFSLITITWCSLIFPLQTQSCQKGHRMLLLHTLHLIKGKMCCFSLIVGRNISFALCESGKLEMRPYPFTSPPSRSLDLWPMLRIDWHSCHSVSGKAFRTHF